VAILVEQLVLGPYNPFLQRGAI